MNDAVRLLKKYFGYDTFRKSQIDPIKSILSGKDTLTIMPTGGGKSICFQIPALIFKEGVTIVISPLISLMKDQVDGLNNSGISSTYINSSLDNLEIEERIYNAINGQYKLIYIAPERLESIDFCNKLKDIKISLLAVDEAHCVSQWGHDFRPSYRKIARFIESLNDRPIVSAFTATATEQVREDIIRLLKLKEPEVFINGFDRENLTLKVLRGENKLDYIINYTSENKEGTGIIYCATRKECEVVYNNLKKRNIRVGIYHAGLSDEERKVAQEDFSYDNIDVIVATNAFGMGIDKSNVRYVVHYNMPKNIEAYYQEIGRAGRDGEKSECILLFSPGDIQTQKYFIDMKNLSPEKKSQEYANLRMMVDYAYTSTCLRKYILEYFGENDVKDNCNNCSVCNDDREEVDMTIEAQKIFSCVYRMRERYGTNVIAEVLKGSKNAKILNLQLDKLSTYGIVKNYTKKELVDIINKLIADNYLITTDDEFPVVRLTEKAIPVLKSKEKLFLKINKKPTKSNKVSGNGLFEILKALRKNIALEEKIPPYIVFTDASLKEMELYMPKDKESFLSIKGVGQSKYDKYGDMFINEINKFREENKIIDEDSRNSINEKEEKVKSHIISYEMYKNGKTIEEICKERDLTTVTVESHLFKCKLEGMDLDINDFINKDYEEEILKAIEKVGMEKLKPIKDIVSKEVDYLSIKSVVFKKANNLY